MVATELFHYIAIFKIKAHILFVLFWITVLAGIVYLFILIVKALKKYVNSKEVREEKKAVAKSLGEACPKRQKLFPAREQRQLHCAGQLPDPCDLRLKEHPRGLPLKIDYAERCIGQCERVKKGCSTLALHLLKKQPIE